MQSLRRLSVIFIPCALLFLAGCGTPGAPKPSHAAKIGPRPASAKLDPLRTWTDNTPVKRALVDFVEQSATAGSAGHIPPAERIAVLSSAAAASGPAPALRELVAYLRSNDYRVYLVTDGAAGSTRDSVGAALGIPGDRVLSPYPESRYTLVDGVPAVVPVGAAASAAKPVTIDRAVGRRPVLALGATADDLEMLEYTTLRNPRPAIAFVLRGTDERLLAAARSRGWLFITPADWTE